MPNRCWLRYFGLRNTSPPNRKSNLEAQQPLTVSRCQSGNRSDGDHRRSEVLRLRAVLVPGRPVVSGTGQVVGVQAFGDGLAQACVLPGDGLHERHSRSNRGPMQ